MSTIATIIGESYPSDLEKYSIHSRFEIIALLKTIIAHRALVTISFGGSRETIVTSLLSVNPEFEEVILDCGADKDSNRRLLNSNELAVTTFVDHVKIQFRAERAESTVYESKPALRVRLPQSILRLQRREYYRLKAPVAKPLRCLIPQLTDARGKPVELRVLDISCGGVGLIVDPQVAELKVGQVFSDCRIDLPDIGVVTTHLEIRSLSALADGAVHQKGLRCGARFDRMQGMMVNLIQRYINKIERERRATA